MLSALRIEGFCCKEGKGMKLALHAFWLAIIGVGCVVTAIFVALMLDRAMRWKGFWNER